MIKDIKINVSIEADEFMKAIQELKEQIDQLTKKMNRLGQTSITVNVGDVVSEINVDQIAKRIGEALDNEINRVLY